MPPERKESTRSISSLASLSADPLARPRPHSSNPTNRRETIESVSEMSSLAALGVDMGSLSRQGSTKSKETKKTKGERKPKMDVARASGIMGFSSGRWLDKSTKDTDPKKELDKALFTRMQDLLKKKREFQKEKAAQQEAMVNYFNTIAPMALYNFCYMAKKILMFYISIGASVESKEKRRSFKRSTQERNNRCPKTICLDEG